MKYVRTKNGIFELKATPLTNKIYKGSNTYMVYDHKELIAKDINGNDIIKQADTIEELCDYWDFYDLVDNTYEIRPIDVYSVYIMKRSLLEEKSASDIKLAIRTDKGLIYVAKMNEKGELELL